MQEVLEVLEKQVSYLFRFSPFRCITSSPRTSCTSRTSSPSSPQPAVVCIPRFISAPSYRLWSPYLLRLTFHHEGRRPRKAPNPGCHPMRCPPGAGGGGGLLGKSSSGTSAPRHLLSLSSPTRLSPPVKSPGKLRL